MQLRKYQSDAILSLSQKFASGKRKIIFQAATGSGKTIIFSAISKRYIEKNAGSVLILVHRKELLNQTRRTLFSKFGISAQIIIAGMHTIPEARVYVGMVESVNKRISLLQNIGLVIIDEAHLNIHYKMHEHFPTQYIAGFTATPLSANKRKPLNMFYEDIVCCVDIPELIKEEALCQNITWAPRDVVERATLTVKNGEYDEGLMAVSFSKPKYINNTVSAYEKWAKGTKTMVFNVNIAHSIAVTQAFVVAGYNCRHLDGGMTGIERERVLNWFHTTHDAILCNVAILTAGYDEPTIETVIMNRSTLSMPLWLQCCGRGSRPTDSKSAFTIIDLGGNAVTLNDWCDPRDWENIFFNPPKKGADGVAPSKNCPQCEAILPASSRTCKFCGYEFPTKEAEVETELSEFIVVTRGINVSEIIENNKHRKEYFPFFKIGGDLARSAKNTVPHMTDDNASFILDKYHELAREWCKAVGKRYNTWHQERAKEHLYMELSKVFKGWNNPLIIA